MAHTALWSAGIMIMLFPVFVFLEGLRKVFNDSKRLYKYTYIVETCSAAILVMMVCEGLLTVFFFGLALMRMGK